MCAELTHCSSDNSGYVTVEEEREGERGVDKLQEGVKSVEEDVKSVEEGVEEDVKSLEEVVEDVKGVEEEVEEETEVVSISGEEDGREKGWCVTMCPQHPCRREQTRWGG